MKRLPIGVDDFKHIVDNDLYFVDKTDFIRQVIDDGSMVTLIARPRRFGKTLNMSMLQYFFEKTEEDNSYLFRDFIIWHQGERYKQEFGKYPVIWLTFKSVKMYKWEENYELITKTITSEFIRHSYLLKTDIIAMEDRKAFEDMCYRRGSRSDYVKSLELLSKALYNYYKEKVVILFDEYDTLLNEAYIHSYWEEAIEFMKAFVNEGFKNNKYLKKGVLTGIFRVAKESIFSDMNNLNVSTILSDEYKEYFGFTQVEVEEMLTYFGIKEKISNVADWYNGYLFGKINKTTIYNPWSLLMFTSKQVLEPYWVNTSGNAIIRKLATEGGRQIQLKIQDIITGGTIDNIKIEENIIYREIMNSDRSIWSFMLMSGYLKPIETRVEEDGTYCTLKAPNKEVYYFFRNMMETWFDETIKGGSVQEMLDALLKGEIKTFYKIFSTTVVRAVSFNDVGDDTSESFYHAFVLGILVYLDKEYEIKSNRESGYGRYDVMIIPKRKEKRGIIIEFKKVDKFDNETMETALEAAMAQIEKKCYDEDLKHRGVMEIVKLAIAFKGKDVRMTWK